MIDSEAGAPLPRADPESPSGYSGSAETLQGPAFPETLESMPEASVPSKPRAMDLVELSENLRKARRFEIGKGFTAIGYVLLGAAAGAAVAGQRLDNKWVMLSGVAGILCVLVGVVMWISQAEKVAAINQRLDIHLRTIKDQKAVNLMREIYRETDDDLLARFKRWYTHCFKDQSKPG